jgi:cytochrome c peroxidase
MKNLTFFALVFLIYSTTSTFANEAIHPLPTNFDYNKPKALLGKKIFHDTRLSKDDTISCASCHMIEMGGDDNLDTSFGIYGQKGPINAPTVLNSRYNLSQFWDGRARNLLEQASGPISNPIEMGSSLQEVLHKLEQDTEYTQRFLELYPDGINIPNILDTIVEFENALVTPDSPFDRYLRGDKSALTTKEKEGYELFKENGCISCHNGVNIGSNLYQKIGILKSYKGTNNRLGRYNVTRKDKDKYVFKVPTLRNIALTAPYLHDGSQSTLKDAVSFMVTYQLGMIPDEKSIDKIVAFLKTLTGKTPEIMKTK